MASNNRGKAPDYAVPEEENNIKIKGKGKIIGEIEEKRERNVKHFLKDNLTFEAAIYNEPVHYYSNGKWKDIDNSLKDSKDEEDNDVLENKENEIKVKIAKNSMAKKLITIKKDNYEIAWGIENVKDKDVKVKDKSQYNPLLRGWKGNKNGNKHSKNRKNKNSSRDLDENAEKMSLPNISSIVEFNDVYTNVDLQYEIKSETVKEKIIIKDRIDNAGFIFNVEIKNLELVLQEDNSIIFVDEKDPSKTIFKIEKPFIYDAKGEVNSDIEVVLTREDKKYKLTYNTSLQWINEQERAFPLILDPPITTPLGAASIQDSFIGSGIPNQNNQLAVLLGVGYGSISHITRSFIKFTLPSLTTADLIIDARLYLWLYTTNYNTRQINVHKVKQDWSSAIITWNNQPQYDTKIEDYQLVKGELGTNFAWDVTSIAKEWYNGTGLNYGFMLKSNDESTDYNEFLSSDTSSAYTNYRPQVTLTYINNSGLQSYWTYHSQDVRRSGTGYINDYNGNVVFVHTDLSMSGSKMPLTLNHVFNSNERDSSIGYGLGWRLNVSQRVEKEIIDSVEWYKYTNESGTKYYFKYDSATGTYKQELGLDLTLIKNADGSYMIKDKDDGKLEFTPSGYLYKIRDKNDNTITLSYGGAVLRTITDGAGRVTTLDTLANGYLVGIIDPSGRRTSFSYNGIQLSRIDYPDGKYSLFAYDANNKLLNVTNHDGYKMVYSYYTQPPYRVKKVQEFASNGLPGGSINISYGYNTTTFLDGANRKNIYQFNDRGNTICIKDDDGSAEYYKYMSGNYTNKLSVDSKLQKFSKNYLKNHNTELQNTDWVLGYWGISQGSGAFTNEEAYMGKNSLKVIKNDTESRHFYGQTLNLTKGKTYVFSAYIKTKDIKNQMGKGAAIFVNYQDNAGAWVRVDSNCISGTNDWARYELKFTLPSDSASNIVYARAGIIEEIGTAYFDCLQLEEGSIANRYNLVENADLTYGYEVPSSWVRNSQCDIYDKSLNIDGKVAFRFNGSSSKNKNISQTIPISGKAGDVFSLGGWAKGASAPLTEGASPKRYFALDIGILKTDDTYQWHIASFNEDTSDWQYVSDRVVADADYKSVTIYGIYYSNANTVYFTNFELYKEEFGYSYTYDSKGNVTSVTDLAKQKSTFEYTNNDLVKAIDPSGGEFNYEYDGKHNITKATSATNVVYSFDYDSSGNPLKAKVGEGSLFIESTARYSLSGNYLKSMTDSEGNSIINHYDENKGILIANTDGKGNKTTYQHDNMDRLLSVSKILGSKNIEKFPLQSNALGTKGTNPIEQSAIFVEDESGDKAFGAFNSTTNLITNSSFENSTFNWVLTDWSGLTGRWRLVQDGVYGRYSLESYDSDNLNDGSATNAVAYQVISLNEAVSTEKQYTLSAYAKRIGSENPVLGIKCYNASGIEITIGYKNYEKSIPENQWVRINQTFTLPVGTKSFMAIIRSSVRDSEKVRFDGVQVEENTTFTPYTSSTSPSSRIYYDLGLDKRSGTLALWFNTKGYSQSRTIIANEGSDKQIFNLYIDEQNIINLI